MIKLLFKFDQQLVFKISDPQYRIINNFLRDLYNASVPVGKQERTVENSLMLACRRMHPLPTESEREIMKFQVWTPKMHKLHHHGFIRRTSYNLYTLYYDLNHGDPIVAPEYFRCRVQDIKNMYPDLPRTHYPAFLNKHFNLVVTYKDIQGISNASRVSNGERIV